jgi:hypothetical protein
MYSFHFVDGRIAEMGPYEELLARNGFFARLIEEFAADEETNDDTKEGGREKEDLSATGTSSGDGQLNIDTRNMLFSFRIDEQQ